MTDVSDDSVNYTLLGSDNHSPGLLRLLAEMKEREGGDPAEVEEIRTIADLMEEQGRKAGLAILTMESIVSFATTLKKETAPEPAPEAVKPLRGNFRVGEIVVPAHGGPCKLEKVFDDAAIAAIKDEAQRDKVRGLANVRFPRAKAVTTVAVSNLRRATPEEQEAYQQAGGV